MGRKHNILPFIAAAAGVGCLAVMDALMKGAALAAGTYTASLLRSLVGMALVAPVWLARGAIWPRRNVMKLHIERGIVSAAMALTWFYALTQLPIAEAIALSFVAPLVALYLAHWLLGEQIGKSAIIASVLGLAGTLVILSGRLGRNELDAGLATGLISLAVSALLYAYNFVIIRKQSQVAQPLEVATFHSGIGALVHLVGLPFFFVWPNMEVLGITALSGLLTVIGAITVAWAYAREEAQWLVPLEYTGFLWASAMGWLIYSERLTLETLTGAALIVVGSMLVARSQARREAKA